MAFFRGKCCLAALTILLSARTTAQPLIPNQNWLPAASGNEPLVIPLPRLPADVYELLFQDAIAIRWNEDLLPARVLHNGSSLEFTVPAELRRPGLTEFVLWNTRAQLPLPYRGRIAVIIPTPAEVFEADPASDRVAAFVAAGESGGGRIDFYRLSSGQLAQRIPVAAPRKVLAFTPDLNHAWIAEDESQGRLVRLSLSSGQTDQAILFAAPEPPYTLSAEVDRSNPRLLMVSVRSNFVNLTRAFLDGVALPAGSPNGVLVPLRHDDRGRVLAPNGQVCELSTTLGFANCTALLPGSNSDWMVVWNNRGLSRAGDVFDLTTGARLAALGASDGSYFKESNRLLFSSHGWIVDGDSLEVWADLGFVLPWRIQEEPRRLWAPDCLLMRALGIRASTQEPVDAIFVGCVPELGPAPSIAELGVVHAASGKAGPLAAGEIISIFGVNLGPPGGWGPVPEAGQRLATEVERTKVLFDGKLGAILYTGDGQINVVVPETVRSSSPIDLQVVRYGIPSARVRMQVGSSSPGLFSYAVQGRRYAAALTADGAVQGPNTPLQRDGVAVFFATGVGLPPQETAEKIATRPAEVPARPSITIGGRPAAVLYAGVSPGLTVGLTQVNVIVPADAPSGNAVEVAISMDGRTEGGVWVAVQ